MGKFEKLIEKLNSQKSDNAWTFDDLVYILEKSKYEKAGGKGSYQVYQNVENQKTIVLAKHGKKIKSGYIRSVRKALNNE